MSEIAASAGGLVALLYCSPITMSTIAVINAIAYVGSSVGIGVGASLGVEAYSSTLRAAVLELRKLLSTSSSGRMTDSNAAGVVIQQQHGIRRERNSCSTQHRGGLIDDTPCDNINRSKYIRTIPRS